MNPATNIAVFSSTLGAAYATACRQREQLRDESERRWLKENLRGTEIDRFIDRVYGIHYRLARWTIAR